MSARTHIVVTTLICTAALFTTATSFAAQWQTNVNYGGTSSPTMDLYVPDTVDDLPGIVVALHYCGGSANAAHGWFQSLADQYGFIIIAGDSAGNCWDSSPGRSGEKAAVVQMVNYTIDQYGANAARVFSVGASSGACLTNSLLASYPDVFAGGSVLAGVPAGAWPSGNTDCNNVCNANPPTKTAAQWGDIVRGAFSFDGPRPKVQLFHGSSDEYLYYPYLAEEVKQWTNVLGLSDTPTSQASNQPSSGWERASYEEGGVVMLEVNTKQGEVHDLTGKGLFPDVIRFFGLDQDVPVGDGSGGTSGGGGTLGGGGNSGVGGSSIDEASGGGSGNGAASGIGGTTNGETSSGGTGNTAAGGSAALGSGGAPAGAASGGTSETGDPTAGADDGLVDESSGCQIARGPRPLGVLGILLLGSVVALVRRRRATA